MCTLACDKAASPIVGSIPLAGIVRDGSGEPVADARVEIISGLFADRFAMTNAQGRFQFADPSSVSDPVTLKISKPGYLSTTFTAGRELALIITLSLEPTTLPSGVYALTLTASNACTSLPAPVRSRTYALTLDLWPSGRFIQELEEAQFFPRLRTITGEVRNGVFNLFLFSDESFRSFGDESPIYERVSNTEYLAIAGRGRAPVAGVGTSIAGPFDGFFEYCARLTEPVQTGGTPGCSVPRVDCTSNSHRFALSRR